MNRYHRLCDRFGGTPAEWRSVIEIVAGEQNLSHADADTLVRNWAAQEMRDETAILDGVDHDSICKALSVSKGTAVYVALRARQSGHGPGKTGRALPFRLPTFDLVVDTRGNPVPGQGVSRPAHGDVAVELDSDGGEPRLVLVTGAGQLDMEQAIRRACDGADRLWPGCEHWFVEFTRYGLRPDGSVYISL
jgi:hypothetical protein